MTQSPQSLLQKDRLGIAWVIGLLVFATLGYALAILNKWSESTQPDWAHAINVAGLQRMLSQKIVQLQFAQLAQPTAGTQEKLERHIEYLALAHTYLLRGSQEAEQMSSPPGNADFRRALLESPFPGLFAINQGGSQIRNDNLSLLDADRTVQTFLERMRSLAQQSDGNLAQTEELILTAQHALATLEAVVSQVMKAETHFRLGQERLIFGFVIVASFLIVAMTILLFRRVQLDPSTAIVEEATRKLEENYNRATLGQISATIVHELAGPLTVISGQVFKIMKLTEDLSPENVEMKREQVHICAETAQDATQRMLRLSRSILSFAKTGRVTQMKPTPVSDILTDAALLIDATAKQFKVSVTIENLVSAESQVFADQSDIVQIVVNLVKNSAEAQFSQGEDPEIKVVVDLQESLNEVRFLVIDYGLGIPEDLAEQIFKPFVTHGKGGKGNGIGLALCQQLADRNSSKLRIASARSPTVFELRVPTQSQRKEHVLPEDDRAA